MVTTQPVARDGVIAALPDGTQVLAKAFQAKLGDPPQSAPTGEGYAIFQVTGIIPAHAPTFADWKTHVLDDYREEQLPALSGQKTKELADQAKATNDLAKAAKAVGATVKTSDLIGETGQVPDFGEVGQVAPQLFDMNVGAMSGPIDARSAPAWWQRSSTSRSRRPAKLRRTSTRREINCWISAGTRHSASS